LSGPIFCGRKSFGSSCARCCRHAPTSPNAYDPTDVALGYVGGILCGADKLSRVAWLQSDAAVAEVLGVEAIASQSTLKPVLRGVHPEELSGLGRLAFPRGLQSASLREGYTLDWTRGRSYTRTAIRQGWRWVTPGWGSALSPAANRRTGGGEADCQLLAAFREHGVCETGRRSSCARRCRSCPPCAHRVGARGLRLRRRQRPGCFASPLGLKFIFVAKLTQKVQSLCRHDDAAWQATGVPGLAVQEVELERRGDA